MWKLLKTVDPLPKGRKEKKMYKFIGYGVSRGTFKGDNGEIEYSNRLIKCITDEVGAGVTGLDFFEQKMKMSDLSRCFDCPETDENVNAYLNSILDQCVEFTFAPIKGKIAVNGFRVVAEPVKAEPPKTDGKKGA